MEGTSELASGWEEKIKWVYAEGLNNAYLSKYFLDIETNPLLPPLFLSLRSSRYGNFLIIEMDELK